MFKLSTQIHTIGLHPNIYRITTLPYMRFQNTSTFLSTETLRYMDTVFTFLLGTNKEHTYTHRLQRSILYNKRLIKRNNNKTSMHWGEMKDLPMIQTFCHKKAYNPFQAVKKMRKLECKCHGISGSCAMRTCWRAMKDFRRVGTFLKKRYNGAVKVRATSPSLSFLRNVSEKSIMFTWNVKSENDTLFFSINEL